MMASCPRGPFVPKAAWNKPHYCSEQVGSSRKFGGELTGYDPVNADRGIDHEIGRRLSVTGANSAVSQRMQWYRR
jgi:hypothetical protein